MPISINIDEILFSSFDGESYVDAQIQKLRYADTHEIEGIISESLSLFEDAKEKFQEVQQISPSDSEYYKKASEKLRDYTD